MRKRTGDIELLSKYFVKLFSDQYNIKEKKEIHPKTFSWMLQYDWPGNVRELENFIHRSIITSQEKHLSDEDYPALSDYKDDKILTLNHNILKQTHFSEAKNRIIKEFEQCYLHLIMEKARGNVTVAAKLAGKERRSFGKLLKKHNISKNHCTYSA